MNWPSPKQTHIPEPEVTPHTTTSINPFTFQEPDNNDTKAEEFTEATETTLSENTASTINNNESNFNTSETNDSDFLLEERPATETTPTQDTNPFFSDTTPTFENTTETKPTNTDTSETLDFDLDVPAFLRNLN